MNFPFKNFGAVFSPRPRKSRLVATWVRDPRSGRMVQTWREVDDGERSCTGRPRGPRTLPRAAGRASKRGLRPVADGGALKRAA